MVAAPGVYDALTAVLAEHAGFEAVFLPGSALAYTQLGRPDVGLLTVSEIAQTLSRMRERTTLPILADGDSGFGNAVNLQRTVRLFERAGASGLQIEDQEPLKTPDDLMGRPLTPLEDMVAKIKAAQDARDDADFVISARTDAMFTLGLDEALRRAAAFADAGADMIFVEGLKDRTQMRRLVQTVCPGQALLHNVLATPPELPVTLDELQKIGYATALFPGVVVQSFASAAKRTLEQLRTGDWTQVFAELPITAADLNRLLGAPAFLELAARYAKSRHEA